MPTGYTANIKDGISFETFTLQCARAFGATIEMEDEPLDKKIPDKFESSDYHDKEIAELNIKYKAIENISPLQAEKIADDEFKEKIAKNKKDIEKTIDLKGKYVDMLTEVKNWKPPSEKHIELKNFMIEQITKSIRCDCDIEYYFEKVKLLTGREWLSNNQNRILKDIAYHIEERQNEHKRVKRDNKWLSELRKSLNI